MTTTMDNQRKHDRVKTILEAHAVVGGGLPNVICQVKNLSDTGARIACDEGTFLPDQFELRIAKRDFIRNVRVHWREGRSVGISFVPDRRPIDRNDVVAWIADLEADNAMLRRRVAELAQRLFDNGESEHVQR